MKRLVFSIGILILISTPTLVTADILEVSPYQAVVLPTKGDGPVQILLRFNLSDMRQGEGRRIDSATLEWMVKEISPDREPEFAVGGMTGPWTSEAGQHAADKVPVETTPEDRWQITSTRYERNQGFVRLNLEALVRDWMTGKRPNHGVLLTVGAVDRDILESQLENIRLVVRYGFMR